MKILIRKTLKSSNSGKNQLHNNAGSMTEQACSVAERNSLSQEGGKNFQGKEILLSYLFNKADADY